MMLEWLTVHHGNDHPKVYSGNFPKVQHPFNRKRGKCRDCGMYAGAQDIHGTQVHTVPESPWFDDEDANIVYCTYCDGMGHTASYHEG